MQLARPSADLERPRLGATVLRCTLRRPSKHNRPPPQRPAVERAALRWQAAGQSGAAVCVSLLGWAAALAPSRSVHVQPLHHPGRLTARVCASLAFPLPLLLPVCLDSHLAILSEYRWPLLDRPPSSSTVLCYVYGTYSCTAARGCFACVFSTPTDGRCREKKILVQ